MISYIHTNNFYHILYYIRITVRYYKQYKTFENVYELSMALLRVKSVTKLLSVKPLFNVL